MAVEFTILGSGSSGNCAYLETGETRILVDAGLSGRQIRQRLAGIGRVPESLTGILVTHEHNDHVQGIAVIAAKLGVPIYCNRLTADAIQRLFDVRFNFRLFETGASFDLGDLHIETFPVPHDASDPVGFVLETSAGNIGFLTDLGYATKLIVERIRRTQVLVLEANHDVKMLQEDTRRPWSVKQRILSRHGHLSNEAAGEVAAEIVTADLSRIYLGHLSRDCNTPELAHATVTRILGQISATHVAIETTSPDVPNSTLALNFPTPSPSPSRPAVTVSPILLEQLPLPVI